MALLMILHLGNAFCNSATPSLVTVLAFVFARDFVFRTHTRWFKIPEERFDEIHYAMMGYYKLAFALFNLVPYLALRIAS